MTDDLDDIELLRRYAEKRSEPAFAEIVRRQINLVYHAALRQTGGNRSLAEEATQTVFTDLARKARSLLGRPVLTGWLFTSTRFAAAKARRAELRRQVRENAAHVMQELTRATATATADWEQLRPVIDDVLAELEERDRDAVLLRFFEDRSFAEIGARLSLTEDTARVRVARALEKMHVRLARRGVKSTTMALAAALGGQAASAAPAGLATAVATAALAGAGGAAAVVGVFGFLSAGKIGGGVAVVAVALAVGVIFFNSDQPVSRPTPLPVTLASVSTSAVATPAEIEKPIQPTVPLARPDTSKSAEVTTAVAKVVASRPTANRPVAIVPDLNYRLRPGDSVLVWVRGYPDTATSQRIGRRGEVRLSLLPEELMIGGKTVREAQRFLENLFRERKLIKAPEFTVVVQASIPRSVLVSGAVESPGIFCFPAEVERLHVDELITGVGGFLRTANPSLVRVTTSDENGRDRNRTLNLNEGVAAKLRRDQNAEDFFIVPGDRVWVPEKR